MNLAHIKLMALLLQALCAVQTVSLHKLAGAMPTAVDRDSNLRRVQRFLKHGKRAKSLVKYGLEEIANVLLRPLYKPKFDVFKFLSVLNNFIIKTYLYEN